MWNTGELYVKLVEPTNAEIVVLDLLVQILFFSGFSLFFDIVLDTNTWIDALPEVEARSILIFCNYHAMSLYESKKKKGLKVLGHKGNMPSASYTWMFSA